MSTLKQLLEKEIMERRPKLGISSVKTYLSILASLYMKMGREILTGSQIIINLF